MYAKNHPAHVSRVVQVGPIQPFLGKQYPARLTGADATLQDVLSRLAALQKERGSSAMIVFPLSAFGAGTELRIRFQGGYTEALKLDEARLAHVR